MEGLMETMTLRKNYFLEETMNRKQPEAVKIYSRR